jgi:hypothetical protein
MKIRPELAALQRDDAPQRRIQAELQAVVERWRGGPAMAGIAADLARLAEGRRLDELLSLAALFAPDGLAAADFAADLVRLIGAELGRQPLAHVPLRHFTNDLITSLLLARCGDVSLSLEAVDGTALPRISPPASVSFSPSQTWERVLAGSGEIERITLAAVHPAGVATLTRQPERVRAGMVIHRNGASEALVLRTAMPRRCWQSWRTSPAVHRCAGRRCANVWGWIPQSALPRCAALPGAMAIRWRLRLRRCRRSWWRIIPSLPGSCHAPRDRVRGCRPGFAGRNNRCAECRRF